VELPGGCQWSGTPLGEIYGVQDWAPALHQFNHKGIAAAQEMDWNKEEEWPIPRSEVELQAIATMEFDWLDCPVLAQSEAVDKPIIDTDDLSVSSFDA